MEQHFYLFAHVVKEPEGVGRGLVEVEGGAVAGLRAGDRKVGGWALSESGFFSLPLCLCLCASPSVSSSEEGRAESRWMPASSESGTCLFCAAVRACPRIIRQEPTPPSRPIIILYGVSLFKARRRSSSSRFAFLGGGSPLASEVLNCSTRKVSRGKTFLQGSLLLANFWLLRNMKMRDV